MSTAPKSESGSAAGRTASPPTAGLLPWVMWGLGALFYCYGFFQRVAPSVMVDELMRAFSVGAAITGTLSALYFFTYAGLQVPIGLLLDRFGPRRILALAGLLGAVGSWAFAQADTLGPAYVGRALIGAGAAVSWVGSLTLAATWFPPRRFALLTGLTMALGMAGAIGGQVPLSAAVEAFGWRGTLMVAGVVAAVLAAAVWLIVRDRPEDMEAGHAKTGESQDEHGFFEGLKATLTESQTFWTTLYGAMMAAPLLAFPGLWGVPYLMSVYHLERPEAAGMTSLFLIGWGIGSPLYGWISDRIGRRRLPMLVSSTVSLLVTLLWLYGGLPLVAIAPLMFLTGLFAGAMVLTFATAREHNPTWAAGATLGFVNMCVMSTGIVFQPLIGWLLDLNWDGTVVEGARLYSEHAYAVALGVLPACYLLALIGALKVTETWCQPVKGG